MPPRRSRSGRAAAGPSGDSGRGRAARRGRGRSGRRGGRCLPYGKTGGYHARDSSCHPPPCMSSEKKAFVNVDELMPQVSLEQAAAFYGVALPELKRVGSEVRTTCFLACGKAAATGDRALAIQAEDPLKKWTCHQAGCGKGGNLISLCDLLKPGASAGGRPRGERFKAIAADLKAMA